MRSTSVGSRRPRSGVEPAGGPCRPSRGSARRAAPVAAPAAAAGGDAARECRHARPLINEAGEVAIARSRVEAELRSIKQALADLTESIARLRSQLREIEVQADSQMQSRLSVLRRARARVRSAGVRPLHALAGADAHDGRGLERRRHDPAGACRRTSARPTPRCCTQARISRERAAGPDAHARGAVRQPDRAPATASCARRRASSTSRPSSRSRARRSSSTAACSSAWPRRSSTCCATRSRTASRSRGARRARARPRPARSRITLRQEGNEIVLVSPTTAPASTSSALREKARRRRACSRAEREPTEAQLAQLIFAVRASRPPTGHRARRPRRRHGRGAHRDHRARRPRRHRRPRAAAAPPSPSTCR